MFQYSQHCPTRLNTAVPAVLISTYQLHTSAVGMAVGAGLAWHSSLNSAGDLVSHECLRCRQVLDSWYLQLVHSCNMEWNVWIRDYNGYTDILIYWYTTHFCRGIFRLSASQVDLEELFERRATELSRIRSIGFHVLPAVPPSLTQALFRWLHSCRVWLQKAMHDAHTHADTYIMHIYHISFTRSIY